MDLYWGRVEKGTFHELLCYGSLFTIFGAGPIERFTNLKPQLQIINSKYQTRYWEEAFIRISTGLFKKLVLADWLGVIVNPVVQNPSIYNPFRLSFTIAAYSLQIYFDFAGYSDIAIGSSKLFGLTVMENFNHPYLAKNIGDFWRRWHISLSIWIRDYLFLPMSRISKIREWMIYLVPPAAMSVCGFWHGSELHFVLWGLLHGIAIDIFQYFRKTRIKLIKTLLKSSLFNLTFVSLAWVVFHAMFKVKELKPPTIIIIVITLPLILLPVQKLLGFFSKKDVIHNARLALVLLILTLALQCFMNTNFIYLNF